MRTVPIRVIVVLAAVCLTAGLLDSSLVKADNSITLTAFGTPYIQDFNSLSASSASNILPVGWALLESGSSGNVDNKYQPSTGNLTTGDIYSFGLDTLNDRALGSIQDANLVPLFGASFTNNTGGVIQSLTIKYTGEEWRLSKSGRSDKIIFEFSTDATSLENGSWTEYDALTFITPYQDTVGAKNGNLMAYRRELLSSISGLSIASGKTFWIRWRDHKITNGINDGLAVDDFSLTPYGVDDAPVLISITPSDKAQNVALDANLVISFSEPVTLSDGWLSLSCSMSQLHIASVSGGPTTFIVNPDDDFVNGDICDINIYASRVSDLDSTDPPDFLDKDYSFSYSAIPLPDSAPIIVKITPAHGESEVLLGSSLTVQFSEPVTIAPGWFSLICSTSGNHAATVDGGPSAFILTPINNFVYDEDCILTIMAANVTDLDLDDPYDNLPTDITSSFSTLRTPDTAPYLISSIPVNGATSVPVDQVIELTFNEPVSMDSKTPTLSCESGGVFSLQVVEGPTTFKVTPSRNLNYGDHCSMTLEAQYVTDLDLVDFPDAMLVDQTINFETAAQPVTPPGITQVIPEDGATNVAFNSDIYISFNKEVSVTDPWVGLNCSISGEHNYKTSKTSQAVVIDPDADFSGNETCTLTVFASQVHGVGTTDSSDQMTENYSFSFTTAPVSEALIITTNPSDHAVDVSVEKDIVITFSKPVMIKDDGVVLFCSVSKSVALTRQEDSRTFTFGYFHPLKYLEDCTMTLKADKVFFKEPENKPVFQDGDYSFTFTTMKASDETSYPTVVYDLKIIPHDNQILHTSLNHLVVQFSKNVLHDGGPFAADYLDNYCLIEGGSNGQIETSSCSNVSVSDAKIPLGNVLYDPATLTVDLSIQDGRFLPNGVYRLIVSGDSTIKDTDGNPLNNGTNSLINFIIDSSNSTSGSDTGQDNSGNNEQNGSNGEGGAETNSAAASKNDSSGIPLIPVTGFPRGVITHLGQQVITYSDLGGQWLEIPALNLETSITGVPKENDNWDVSWLGDQAGWLESSAQLGNLGNTVLTAHVWDALNKPGPFYELGKLKYGDRVILHAWGDEYVYEVREVLSVKPENVNAMLKHQEKSWLTLVTCQGYDEESGEYKHRILVRAVLMEVR